MYLYTEGGKDVLGGISDTQMQTTLATALATSNQAMDNSAIDLTLSLVYIGLVRRFPGSAVIRIGRNAPAGILNRGHQGLGHS